MAPRSKNTNRLEFSVAVDPKSVSANKKEWGKNGYYIPAGVRKGQKAIGDAAKKAAKDQGWSVPIGPLGIILTFTFNDRRGDADNSIKRTIDAIQDKSSLNFDDAKIVEGLWKREMGDPGIRVVLYETTLPDGDDQGKSYRNAPVFVLPEIPKRENKNGRHDREV